ncbi:MAG: murein biosynthesis integral membrane protein MurJ [Gemmatimonadaceae bacterium]
MTESASGETQPVAEAAASAAGRAATLVAAGILVSRVAGLARNWALARFLGVSDATDALTAAFRIPNLLQNLFGEGVLSASFIPVYAGLLARGEQAEARRVASAIAGLLSLVIALLVLVGILATPILVDVLTPGFEGPKRDLAIRLVRILFPGAGMLVLSAWCLGILNSHRRFFVAYVAPVFWNLSIIGALLYYGGSMADFPLAVVVAWASVAGSFLQFAVQLPLVIRLAGAIRPTLDTRIAGVRRAARSFGPVLMGRGVVQISAYVDTVLASLIASGALAILSFAQVLYTLPVSLFGMAVSAAELPAMASVTGTQEGIAAQLRARIASGARRIAFLVIPSAVAFLAFGDMIAGMLFQWGEFSRADTLWVWATLAGSTVGLLASTLGRLYSSAFYALHDTTTPFRFAVTRVAIALALGYFLALRLPDWLGVNPRWGLVGLTAAAGIAAWVEYLLLRQRLSARLGGARVGVSLLARLWGAGLLAAAAGWGARLLTDAAPRLVGGFLVLAVFGASYLGLAALLGVPQVRTMWSRSRAG